MAGAVVKDALAVICAALLELAGCTLELTGCTMDAREVGLATMLLELEPAGDE